MKIKMTDDDIVRTIKALEAYKPYTVKQRAELEKTKGFYKFLVKEEENATNLENILKNTYENVLDFTENDLFTISNALSLLQVNIGDMILEQGNDYKINNVYGLFLQKEHSTTKQLLDVIQWYQNFLEKEGK